MSEILWKSNYNQQKPGILTLNDIINSLGCYKIYYEKEKELENYIIVQRTYRASDSGEYFIYIALCFNSFNGSSKMSCVFYTESCIRKMFHSNWFIKVDPRVTISLDFS